jgi:hypothetical protein
MALVFGFDKVTDSKMRIDSRMTRITGQPVSLLSEYTTRKLYEDRKTVKKEVKSSLSLVVKGFAERQRKE